MSDRISRIWIVSTLISLIFFVIFLLPVSGRSTQRSVRLAKKLSPILQEEVASLTANPNQDYPMAIIVQVDAGFFAHTEEIRRQRGEDSNNALSLIRSYTATLKAGHIKLLLESDSVEYVTLDALIRPDADWGGPGWSSGG